MDQHIAFICIGGNLGEREANLEETRMFVEFNMGDILDASSVYESEPWQMTDVPPFLNQVLKISTELNEQDLLEEIAELEEFYGRERSTESYLSREMDIDILYFDDMIQESAELVVPHPRMHLRKFVLMPLAEIAPDLVHPVLKKTTLQLLKDCEDQTSVVKK